MPKKKEEKKKGKADLTTVLHIIELPHLHMKLAIWFSFPFCMFHSNWVISDYHSFVWQFEFPWLNLTNCPNKWMVIRNDPVTVKHTKWIFTDAGKVMMAFILATDFDFIAYMSKMAFFGKLFSRQWRFWNMMLIYWSVPDRLVTPGTESLTLHIDLLDAVTHTHLRLANLAKHKPVSTFSFSHLQNFHLFFTDASILDTSAFSPFASTIRKDEIYDQVVGSLSGQVFESGCH